jgi:predicted nucleic acid-binding protein
MLKLPFFDTNVYGNREYTRLLDLALQRKHWLSSVVIQELLVVADDEELKFYQERLNEAKERDLLINPTSNDWYEVGKCLNRLHRGHIVNVGKLDAGQLNNLVKDALIARCAMRVEGFVVTENTRDFDIIKKVFRSLRFTSPSTYFQTRPR